MDVLQESSAVVITTASTAASPSATSAWTTSTTPAASTPRRPTRTSKLENILFTRELHRRYAGRGIRAVAFHPGNVASNFASGTTSNWRLVYDTPLRHVALTSPDKAARTLLWLANGTPGTRPVLRQEQARHPQPQVGDDALAAAASARNLKF